MNILPLVFAFLLIFASLHLTFQRGVRGASLMSLAAHGKDCAEKAVHNALVRKQYKAVQPRAPRVPGAQQPRWHSPRVTFPPTEASKLYLRPFVTTDRRGHPLQDALEELFVSLYAGKVCDVEPCRLVVRALMQHLADYPETTDLSQLYPDDTTLRALYYQMLRGTTSYDEMQGVAPLSHFLSLEKTSTVASLKAASPPVLRALLGGALADDLLAWEEEHQATCPRKEVLNLPARDPRAADQLQRALPHLGEHSLAQGARHNLIKRDEATGIQIERASK